MKIICPVCKSLLDFELSSTERLDCQACETSFSAEKIRQAIRKHAQKSSTSRNKAAEHDPDHSSELVAASKSPKLEAARDAFDEIQVNKPAIDSQTGNLTKLRKNKSARRIYTVLTLILLAIFLSVTIALIGPLQTEKLNQDAEIAPFIGSGELEFGSIELPAADDKDHPRSGSNTNVRTKNSLGNVDQDEQNTPTIPRKPFADVDQADATHAKPANRIKPKRVLDDCWLRTRDYFVELQAETAVGPRFATGTIIDSRGWVVTSYQAMAGASKIHFRRARNSIETSADEMPVDQVRGVVGFKPVHDLLILAINRRFVDTFEDLPIVDYENVVASRYLVQCQPPTIAYPYPAVETRVGKRVKIG